MSYTNKDWQNAVSKILELTSKNEISWDVSDLDKGDAWTEVDNCIESNYKSKTYVISEVRGRNYTDIDEFYWTYSSKLLIFERTEGAHKLIAEAPELSSLGALLEAAKSNMAFNKKALDDLL